MTKFEQFPSGKMPEQEQKDTKRIYDEHLQEMMNLNALENSIRQYTKTHKINVETTLEEFLRAITEHKETLLAQLRDKQ